MKKILKRLTVALLIVGGIIALLFSYFGEDIGGGDKASLKPTMGGDVVIGLPDEPAILNPFLPEGTSMPTKLVTSNVLWGLLVVTPDLEYAPRIAETVPTVENGLVTLKPFTVTYKIREDAVWSDETPITSWDVKFTWETIMDQKRDVADRSGYDKISEIYTPDAKTVKLVFREPYADYKELFSATYCVLPKHILEGKSYDETLSQVIPFASGPYMFKEWKRGDHLTLVRNEKFWDKRPNIDMVTFRFIGDAGKQIEGFADGEIDVLYPASDKRIFDELYKIAGKTVLIDPSLIWEHIAFNLSKPPLNDPNVRKALAHAINREAIVKAATGESDVLQSIVMPEQKPYYTAAWKRYDFDVEKAKGYLRKAGYQRGTGGYFEKNGAPLTLTISTTAESASRTHVEELLKNDLASAGIQVRIQNADTQSFFSAVLPQGDFDIATWAWMGSPEPDLARMFAANRMPPDGFNYYRYKNNEVTAALAKLSGRVDAAGRVELYRSVQEKLCDDAVVIPLYRHPQILAHNKKVMGVKNNVSFEGPFWNLGEWWIAK